MTVNLQRLPKGETFNISLLEDLRFHDHSEKSFYCQSPQVSGCRMTPKDTVFVHESSVKKRVLFCDCEHHEFSYGLAHQKGVSQIKNWAHKSTQCFKSLATSTFFELRWQWELTGVNLHLKQIVYLIDLQWVRLIVWADDKAYRRYSTHSYQVYQSLQTITLSLNIVHLLQQHNNTTH